MSQRSHIQIPFNSLIPDVQSFIVEGEEKKPFLANAIVRGLTGPPSFRGAGFWVWMLPDKDITKRACLWHEKTLSVQ